MHKPAKTERTMEQRAISALQQTWQAIGYDYLVAMAEADGKNAERMVVNEDEVREAVSTCGFKGGYPASYGNDKEAVDWLEKLPSEEQDAVLAKAFPKGRYGV